jgi:sugar/nucleoside kinase (ribokinase family)
VSAAYVAPQKVLIVNTNGGGHANIGFWLSKILAGKEEKKETIGRNLALVDVVPVQSR